MPSSKYVWLSDALSNGGEVITASRRLSRELRQAYDADQLDRGREAWLTPAIWSWSDWLSRQLAAASEPLEIPVLLDSHSAELLWEQCLAQHIAEDLPGFTSLARQTFDSWQRLEEWRVFVAELTAAARSQDEQLFAATATDYARKLRANRWMDMGGKAAVVATLIASKRCLPPPRIVLAGFDRINPATAEVITAIEGQGCRAEKSPSPSVQEKPGLCAYVHLEAEMRAAGRWARERLDANPCAEIAIVVPALDADSSGVARLVKEGLVPGWQFGEPKFAAAANVSYGRKLVEYPAVVVAMLLLRWIQHGLNSREVGVLLRSRCIACDDMGNRVRVESRLRRFPDRTWSPAAFQAHFAPREEHADARTFMGCVATLADMQDQIRHVASPGEWAERIDQWLAAVFWPGPATLDSDEFQLINRWRELLNEFARLQIVAPTMNFGEAIRRLNAMASDVLYQPESGTGLVRVLGSLEAAGMEFDAVWISGLDASQWPAKANPTKFVSFALQRKHGMPDATPADTLSFARQVLGGLISSSSEPILSWVATRDDLELTPSGLLEEFTPESIETEIDPGWFARSLIGQDEFHVETDTPPAIGEAEQVRGGAYTVQRQYAEPLSAFVHGRLGVRSLEPIETGLSASVRGNIIHHALHNLYVHKPSQSEIAAWSNEDRIKRVGSAVDMALAKQHRLGDELHRRLLGLERNRLLQLLQDFVAAECMREEFAVVDLEEKLDYSKFGVNLGLRVDRIDRLVDGEMLIIDYKTGLPKHFLNGSGDLTDLQLVVYAVAHGGPIGGLALLNVDSRSVQGKGAGAGGFGKHPIDDWPATLDAWRAEVDRSLQALAGGDVRVNLMMSVAESRPLAILSRKEELLRAN